MKRDNYNIFGQWEFPENETLKLIEKEMVKLGSQGMIVHPLSRTDIPGRRDSMCNDTKVIQYDVNLPSSQNAS